MRRLLKIIILGLLLSPLTAAAQQAQTVAPSQASNAICANAISLALALEQQQQINAKMEKELNELKHQTKGNTND